MPDNVLVFYGSYRATRVGIRMASFVINELRACGDLPELIDAREIGLPILDRMYKEYPKGSPLRFGNGGSLRPQNPHRGRFCVRRGEYNLGPQPAYSLEEPYRSLPLSWSEWFWRPSLPSSAIRRVVWSGVRAGSAWHPILSEMGMVVISSTVAVGPITQTLDAQGEPIGEAGRLAQKALRAGSPMTLHGGPRPPATSVSRKRRLTDSLAGGPPGQTVVGVVTSGQGIIRRI